MAIFDMSVAAMSADDRHHRQTVPRNHCQLDESTPTIALHQLVHIVRR